MRETREIIFANRKGGSGKTSVVVNLAYNLAKKKKKVLVIDLDSQAHSTFYFNFNLNDQNKCLFDLFQEEVDINDLIEKTSYQDLHLLPSSNRVAELNEKIRDEKIFFLADSLGSLQQKYDFILIDLPPSLEKIVICGLIAATEVMIPLQTHFFPMQGIAQLIKLIYQVNKKWGKDLAISGIIPTLYDQRTRIYKNVMAEIEETFGKKMILPGIPYDIRLAEAPSYRIPVNEYSARSRAAEAFEVLTKHIMRMKD